MSHLESWVTLGKNCYTRINRSHLAKSVIPRKMGQVWKNGSHFETFETHGKKCDTLKNGSHLAKSVTAEKMGHLAKRLHLEN